MQSGTWNVLKTGEPGIDLRQYPRNSRLMLGMSVDRATAETYLARYRMKAPHMSFELVDDAPPTTCEIPVLHTTRH